MEALVREPLCMGQRVRHIGCLCFADIFDHPACRCAGVQINAVIPLDQRRGITRDRLFFCNLEIFFLHHRKFFVDNLGCTQCNRPAEHLCQPALLIERNDITPDRRFRTVENFLQLRYSDALPLIYQPYNFFLTFFC